MNNADSLPRNQTSHPRASHPSSTQAVEALLPFLKPGGVCILTLKMKGFGRDRYKTFESLKAIFAVSLILL